jgi:hypothetical protein
MIVLARGFGELGNRLLTSAHLANLAAQYETSFLDLDFPYYPFFQRPPKFLKGPLRLRRAVFDRPHPWQALPGIQYIELGLHADATLFSNRLHAALKAGRPVALRLFDWMPPAFRGTPAPRVAARIRRAFTPAEPWATQAEQTVAEARHGCEILIGVHMRHGDFKVFDGGRLFLPPETTVGAMRAAEKTFAAAFAGRRVGFLICSDEPQPPAAFEGLRYTPGPGHMVADMTALAHCDFILKPPVSTFARWASFWGEVPLWTIPPSGHVPPPPEFRIASLDPFDG